MGRGLDVREQPHSTARDDVATIFKHRSGDSPRTARERASHEIVGIPQPLARLLRPKLTAATFVCLIAMPLCMSRMCLPAVTAFA